MQFALHVVHSGLFPHEDYYMVRSTKCKDVGTYWTTILKQLPHLKRWSFIMAHREKRSASSTSTAWCNPTIQARRAGGNSRDNISSAPRYSIVRVFLLSRDVRSFPRLLLWRLPFSLTPSLPPLLPAPSPLPHLILLLLLPPSLLAARPLSLCLPRPFISSPLVLSRRLVGVGERISRVLEFWWEFVEDGACCDRVSPRFSAGAETGAKLFHK